MLKYIVCLCKGCGGCCVLCLYCEAWSCRCSCMGSMSVSSCRCCMFVSCVHPVAVLIAEFCMTCSLLMLVQDARGDHIEEKKTQPTSGGAVTADSICCANCVEPSRPQQCGPDLPFFGHAGHAEPLDGWLCCSQKRVMSRPIQVRQL